MINRRFSAEARAKELGLSAELAFDTASNELLLDLRADQAHAIDQETRLRLFFSHPAKAERDGIVELVKHAEMNDGSMRYRADLDMPLEGRHYVRLSALENNGVENNDELWRMSGEINFVQTSRVVLQP